MGSLVYSALMVLPVVLGEFGPYDKRRDHLHVSSEVDSTTCTGMLDPFPMSSTHELNMSA